MADLEKPELPEQKAPAAPVLLFPQEQLVVECGTLRLVWDSVEDATAYFVEIATDPAFENVVFEKNVGTANNIGIEAGLPGDGQTYYWRVFAGNEAGWSQGENIESFICGAAADLETGHTSPDIEEEYGPAVRLFKGAAVEVAADVTEADSMVQLEQEMGVAHEGIEAKQIMGFVLAVVVALIVIVIVIFVYTNMVAQTTQRDVEARGVYPELEETRRHAEEQLGGYGVLDPEAGRYRIPIDRAMELIVRERGEPVEEEQEQPGPPVDSNAPTEEEEGGE